MKRLRWLLLLLGGAVACAQTQTLVPSISMPGIALGSPDAPLCGTVDPRDALATRDFWKCVADQDDAARLRENVAQVARDTRIGLCLLRLERLHWWRRLKRHQPSDCSKS